MSDSAIEESAVQIVDLRKILEGILWLVYDEEIM